MCGCLVEFRQTVSNHPTAWHLVPRTCLVPLQSVGASSGGIEWSAEALLTGHTHSTALNIGSEDVADVFEIARHCAGARESARRSTIAAKEHELANWLVKPSSCCVHQSLV